MNKIINKNKIILLITATAIAGFSVFYATASIFKTNTQVVNDLTSGLVGYFTFDGQDTNWGANTITDRSGNNNTGTMFNISTSTSPAAGVMGQALNFDGSNDYVAINDNSSIFITSPLTFSAWFKLKAVPTGVQRVILKSEGYTIRIDPDAVYCRDAYTGLGADLIPYTWTVGAWYHIVCVISGTGAGQQTMYINGVNAGATGTGWDGIGGPGSSLVIGSNEGTSNFFNGSIDEVRVYNRALSVSEANELYNLGAKRLAAINNNQKTNIVSSGLVGYWSFDGPDINWASGVATDVSGNGNNGQIINMSTTTSPAGGAVGQAFDFDNTNDSIELSSGFMDWASTQPFSFSFWTFGDDDNDQDYIFSKYDPATNRGIALSYDQNNSWVQLNINSSATTRIAVRILGMDYNMWQHWVVTYDGSRLGSGVKGYLNSIDQGVTPFRDNLDTNTIQNSITARIGNYNGSSAFTNAGLDEFRVYNRVLSPGEVAELYNQGGKRLVKVNMPQTDLIPNGLVVYWPFDGQQTNWGANTTNDLSGYGNTGTIINMSTSSSPVAGIAGQALKFDGSNDYISKTSATGLPTGNNSFTMSAWIKTSSLVRAFISWGSTPNEFIVSGSPRKLRHAFDWSNILNGNTTLSSDVWYHAAVTYDGVTRKIYLNGLLDGTDNPAAFAVVGTNLNIGEEYYNENFFNGSIDEVRIYNRALSASEVMELYRAGAGL